MLSFVHFPPAFAYNILEMLNLLTFLDVFIQNTIFKNALIHFDSALYSGIKVFPSLVATLQVK